MCSIACLPLGFLDGRDDPSSHSVHRMMARTTQSLGSVPTSTEEKDWLHSRSRHRSSARDSSHCNSKIYPDLKRKVTQIDGWYNPPWVGVELRNRPVLLTQAPYGEPSWVGGEELRNRPVLPTQSLHGDPSWDGGELRNRELALSTQVPCRYSQGTASVPLPHSQARKRNHKVAHDEGTSFVASLRACTKNKDLYGGTKLHNDILKRGLLEICADALVTMYAKCGALPKAKAILDMHPSRDVITWTALIAGYARAWQSQDALDCYERMRCESIPPDAVTYACVLKACGATGAADKGKQIHDEIVRLGLLQNDIVLGSALVDMYAKCGALAKAHCVLEELPFRDVISWNALITGYTQHGQGEQALNCFECMQLEGIHLNSVTYASILKACGTIGAVDKGRQIHGKIARYSLLRNDTVLGSALVDMYAKCGALEKAQCVLEELPSRDAASWSALIAGYTQQGQGEEALNSFEGMRREGVSPDAVTYACVLKACGIIGAADKGKDIHDEIAQQGLLRDNIVLGSTLVDMYAKCGALEKAQGVLEELPSRDVFSWSALITGYAQQGQGEQALNCFERMQQEGIPPDAVTCSCVLNVCSHLGLVEEAHMLFVDMCTNYGVKPNLETYTCMIDLFGRAGHLEKAVRLIRELPSSDYSAVWRALLGACQKWGDANVGRWAFDQAVQVDKRDGASYILMANIYAAAGMQEKVKDIEVMRVENGAWNCQGVVCGRI